jgi:hypothetical protein
MELGTIPRDTLDNRCFLHSPADYLHRRFDLVRLVRETGKHRRPVDQTQFRHQFDTGLTDQ